jgi:RNA polymerase sigma factor (sigma-70 family)
MEAALSLALDGDVLAAQRGDKEAFSRLIDATQNVVCAIIVAIVRDVPSSEDVAQEVFVAAWGSVTKLRNPSSFLPWLRQLARNQAHTFIRARSRFGRRHAPWSDEVATMADPAADARRMLIEHEDRRALAEAMEQLPDEAREIVILYYREGKSTRQVADVLGLREDAVKKRLERSRASLRQALIERAGEALRKTAPGAGFTAGVIAAITHATPATAAAATASVTKALGTTSTAVVGGALGGAVLGPASAVGAIAWGGRILWRRARDDRERAGLAVLLSVNIAATVAVGIAWWLAKDLGATFQGISWALYALLVMLSYNIWLPRIIGPRLALERLEDPDAERRHRRQRIHALVGSTIGFGLGLAGLIYGLTHR